MKLLSSTLSKKNLIFFSFFFILFSCHGQELPDLDHIPLSIEGSTNILELDTLVAQTDATRAEGLKYIRRLPKYTAMIFVFSRPQRLSFWMQDTYVPLSIAYINHQGMIMQIEYMKPLDESPVPSNKAAKYALEVRQGLFEEYNIQEGDYIKGLKLLSP